MVVCEHRTTASGSAVFEVEAVIDCGESGLISSLACRTGLEKRPVRLGRLSCQLLGNQADRRDRRGTVRRGGVAGAKKRCARCWTARSRSDSACSAARRWLKRAVRSWPGAGKTDVESASEDATVAGDTVVSPWAQALRNVGLGKQADKWRAPLASFEAWPRGSFNEGVSRGGAFVTRLSFLLAGCCRSGLGEFSPDAVGAGGERGCGPTEPAEGGRGRGD